MTDKEKLRKVLKGAWTVIHHAYSEPIDEDDRDEALENIEAILTATKGEAEDLVVWEEQQILRFVETRNLDCHWLVCDENGLSAGLTIPIADKEEGQKLDREHVVVQVRRKG